MVQLWALSGSAWERPSQQLPAEGNSFSAAKQAPSVCTSLSSGRGEQMTEIQSSYPKLVIDVSVATEPHILFQLRSAQCLTGLLPFPVSSSRCLIACHSRPLTVFSRSALLLNGYEASVAGFARLIGETRSRICERPILLPLLSYTNAIPGR